MFSHQQITAANNIQEAFATVRYAMLVAKCQSGKTGCYHSLIKMMLDKDTVQRVYIVCGSAETILRDQAHEDAIKFNPDHVANGRIHIIFHQDFNASVVDVCNTLFVIDESHLVQTKGQGLHTFLGRNGITLDGNPTNLVAKNTYVLSVDATPYSEIASLSHKETPFEKYVEKLEPGEGYIGLTMFYITDRIKPTFDITTDAGNRNFAKLLALQGKRYMLMRLNNNNRSEAVVRNICEKNGYSVLYYTSNQTDIAITRKEQAAAKNVIPCLEDPPAVTTVVIIRGRLRAGKVVPKQHIGAVWEGAKTSKTDTIIQGLAGRMCGYYSFTPEISIFLPPSVLETLKGKALRYSEIERAIEIEDKQVIPRNGMNIKKGAVAAAPVNGKTACVPLCMEWDGTQLEDLAGRQKDLKCEARELLLRNLHLVDNSDNYTPEQKAEIRAAAERPVSEHHVRRMTTGSKQAYKSFYRNIMEAHKNKTATAENVSECPAITYIITEPGFDGLRLPGASSRYVYVMLYTMAKGRMDRSDIDLHSRIPTTTGRSIFSLDTTQFEKPVGAAGLIGIALEDTKTPEKLEPRIREILKLWRESQLVVGRELKSPDGGCFKMSKRHYHYTSDKENDIRRICRRLEVEFNLKKNQIVVKFARSSADMFNLKSISW